MLKRSFILKIALIQGSSQKDKNPLLDLKKLCNIRNFFFMQRMRQSHLGIIIIPPVLRRQFPFCLFSGRTE